MAAIDDKFAELLGLNTKFFAAYQAWSEGQINLLAGTIDDPDSFDKDGGKAGALGYYPVVNVSGQTVFVPCIARLRSLALGGENAETLDALLATTAEKLAAVDASKQSVDSAREQAIAATEAAQTTTAQAQAVVDAGPQILVARDQTLDARNAATAAATEVGKKLIAISPRAGWLHPFTDKDDTTVGGWKNDASFWTAITGNIDAVIASLRTGSAALLARVDATAPAQISSRAGWLHSFTDTTSLMLGGWKNDASFWTAITGNIDAAISNLKSSMTAIVSKSPITLSRRAGWLHVFTDRDGGRLFGANTEGDFIIGAGTNVSQFFREGGASSDLKAVLTPTPDIMIYGDSETENSLGWPALGTLFAEIGEQRAVTTSGFGGQGAKSILARQGGMPTLVTLPPSGSLARPTIPADTAPVSVTVTNSPLAYADPSQAKSMTGVFPIGRDGVVGTLTRLANSSNYTFARAAAGAAIAVDAALPFLPNNDALIRRIQICWIGTNDLNPAATPAETLFSYMEAYGARQATVRKRTVFLMPVWDMSNPNFAARRVIYDALLALVKGKYPHCYVDTVAVLQRAVVNPDATDQADIANNLIPRSIMAGDRLHFPPGGAAYAALAVEIFNIIKRNGW